MVLRMRGMVSPTGAAGVVRVALRAETLECVATLYYTHPTHAARAQAETAADRRLGTSLKYPVLH